MIFLILKNITIMSIYAYRKIEDPFDYQMKSGLILIATSGLLYVSFIILLIIVDQTEITGLSILIALILFCYMLTFYIGYVMPGWFITLLEKYKKNKLNH
jgi:hypothetical protein